MDNIKIGKTSIGDNNGRHSWNYGYLSRLNIYRSKVYVDRIIGYKVFMRTDFGEAYPLEKHILWHLHI